MKTLRGIPASRGMVIGSAFHFRRADLSFERYAADDQAVEWARFQAGLETARQQLADVYSKAEAEFGAEHSAIFQAHAMMLEDPGLLEATRVLIQEQGINAEAAWFDAIETYAQKMAALEDEYLRARAADIRDVGQRVLRLLIGKEEVGLSTLTVPSIIVARDLTPSDTVLLDKTLVLAFCTAEGGPTSHTAILAKALGLPAVVGLGPALLDLPNGAPLLVDGDRGEVVAYPDKATLQGFRARGLQAAQQAHAEQGAAHEPAVTRDGHQVEVVANVGGVEEAIMALEFGAEGIGLLRTEFLYLERETEPDEEEQLAAYDAVLDVMGTRPVVVRTLDVGGDKELGYIDLGRETNPFLGWRAIRMCLDRPAFFKAQLRALLRASPGHNLRIMFPMIAILDEVRRAKALLDEARREVEAAGHPTAKTIQVGIMVEVPSVAVLADLFAPEVHFFSIGTNDLTQYTMAVDRTNDKVVHLGDACHPAVVRQIQRVIEAGHQVGIRVGVCGEMASDPEAVPILLGLGLDEFSIAPASIPRAKATVRSWSLDDARRLAAEAVRLESAEAVRERVRAWQP